jgi:hypothetical protein
MNRLSRPLLLALGGSVGHPMGIFYPKNTQLHRTGDFWSCEETVGTRMMRIFYNTSPVTEEGKNLAQQQEDRYGKEGYQIPNRELNGLQCATTVPPANPKDLPPPGLLRKQSARGSKGLITS